jgi:hypothetical protein
MYLIAANGLGALGSADILILLLEFVVEAK